MKRIYQFSIALLLIFATIGLISQMQEAGARANAANKAVAFATMDEYVYMKSHEMMWHYNGKDMVLAATYLCSDGTKVSTTGLVTKRDSTTLQLMNGDKVFADGTIMQAQPSIMDGK